MIKVREQGDKSLAYDLTRATYPEVEGLLPVLRWMQARGADVVDDDGEVVLGLRATPLKGKTLTVVFATEAADHIMTRGAGQGRLSLVGDPSDEDLVELSALGAQEASQRLGCSRATYFRRLKEARERLAAEAQDGGEEA